MLNTKRINHTTFLIKFYANYLKIKFQRLYSAKTETATRETVDIILIKMSIQGVAVGFYVSLRSGSGRHCGRDDGGRRHRGQTIWAKGEGQWN